MNNIFIVFRDVDLNLLSKKNYKAIQVTLIEKKDENIQLNGYGTLYMQNRNYFIYTIMLDHEYTIFTRKAFPLSLFKEQNC